MSPLIGAHVRATVSDNPALCAAPVEGEILDAACLPSCGWFLLVEDPTGLRNVAVCTYTVIITRRGGEPG